jgi:hypothetical protein
MKEPRTTSRTDCFVRSNFFFRAARRRKGDRWSSTTIHSNPDLPQIVSTGKLLFTADLRWIPQLHSCHRPTLLYFILTVTLHRSALPLR